MKPATVEAWVWILIYGGMLVLSLGLFVRRSDAALGWVLGVAGAVLVATGVLLIYLRSRMRD
jgi:threonine/homoserine/homoserine lactone efflux protein